MGKIGEEDTDITWSLQRDQLISPDDSKIEKSVTPYMECIEGPNCGRRYLLVSSRLVIGREQQCNIIFADPVVSRTHATINIEGDEFVIEDCNSANHTFVNGIQIKKTALKHADEIMIGSTRLKVTIPNK